LNKAAKPDSGVYQDFAFCIRDAVCNNEGQGCGSRYPGITCCTGLQCDGSHCRKPGACIHADGVCGKGSANPNSKCCDGLKCVSNHCTKPGSPCQRGMAIANWHQMVGLDRRDTVEKPEDCQALCVSNPDCLFWTYKKTAGNGVNGVAGSCCDNCLIKANLEKLTPNSDFISGCKHCTFPAV